LLRGTTVNVGAVTSKMDLENEATESADGVGSGANVNAFITVKNQSQVSFAADSVVSGDTVRIESSHEDVDLRSFAEATAFAFVGIPNSHAKVDYDSDANVYAAPGSLVSGGTITVDAKQDIQSFSRESFENAWQFCFIGNLLTSGNWGQNSKIELGVRPTERQTHHRLEWGLGRCIRAEPQTGCRQYRQDCGSHRRDGGRQRQRSIRDGCHCVGRSDPQYDQHLQFHYLHHERFSKAHDGLSIARRCDLQVRERHRQCGDGVPNGRHHQRVEQGSGDQWDSARESQYAVPTVRLNAPAPSYTFVVGVAIPPTDITIINRGANGRVLLNAPSGNLVPGSSALGFSIYNPVGSTSITSERSIEHASGSSRVPTIWTRSLELDAGAGIGSSSNRLAVDLVLPFGQTDFNAIANGDVFLDLEGRVRSASIAQPVFAGSNIQTTGDINILLQPTVREVVAQSQYGLWNGQPRHQRNAT
jgi:hypothetical protein